jgi:hypothetical protein
MQMFYTQSQEAPTQQFAGVTGGIGDLNIHPVTQQYEAKPRMDESGENELGMHIGDRYAATALNQMNRRNLKEGETRALGAGQTAFDRGSKYGEMAHNFGNRMGSTIGVLAGLTQLANAGAAGQDAFTGGVGAYQTGQVTADSVKKPLAEGLGGAAANIAGRSVGVVKPEVAEPTPQVAEPTHSEDEMINYQGQREVMSTDKFGNPVPFKSKQAQAGAEARLAQTRGEDTSAGTVMQDYQPPMGGGVAVRDGMATGQGGQTTFTTGNPAQDTANVRAANQVAVASPTPETSDIDDKTGQTIADNTTGNVEDAQAGAEIKNNIDAAKQQSGKKQSMTQQTQLPIEKMLVGVV